MTILAVALTLAGTPAFGQVTNQVINPTPA
jgi:hypothetical protein